jgi:predicted PurR-regulated permease PerM
MFMLLGVTALAFMLFWPFLTAILAAAILAATFYGTYKGILKKIKSKSFSSIITCILVFLIIVLPVFAVLGLVANELGSAYQKIVANNNFYQDRVSGIFEGIRSSQVVSSFSLDNFLNQENISNSIQSAGGNAVMVIQKTYQNIFVAFRTK